jgi:hypothetical protein
VTTFDVMFSAGNAVALIGWAGLVLAPGRNVVTGMIAARFIPALLAVAYTALVAAFFAGAEGGFSSIAAVRQLFQSDGLLVAGWLHYLAFDLFVGSWEVRTARAERIPHLLVLPCLALTFLFGPMGLLAFLILRTARAPRVALEA